MSPESIDLGFARRIKVLVVDGQPLFRYAITSLLDAETDFAVCGEAGSRAETLSLIKSKQPQIVILDLMLKNTFGVETIKAIKKRYPAINILMFSGHDEAVYAPRALRAGASGYVTKKTSAQNLLKALRKVASGGLYLNPDLGEQLLKRLLTGETAPVRSPVELLSDSELQVFVLIGKGATPLEIAFRQKKNLKTIDMYRANIKRKLKLKSPIEVTRQAVEWIKSQPPSQ